MSFKKEFKNIIDTTSIFLKKYWFLIFIVLLAIIKQVIASNIPVYMNITDFQDVEIADTILNSDYLGEYTAVSVFLYIINRIGISYLSATTLLYTFSCLFFIFAIKELFTKNPKIYLSIIYITLLFNPISLSIMVFQRVCYNALEISYTLIILGIFIKLYLLTDKIIERIKAKNKIKSKIKDKLQYIKTLFFIIPLIILAFPLLTTGNEYKSQLTKSLTKVAEYVVEYKEVQTMDVDSELDEDKTKMYISVTGNLPKTETTEKSVNIANNIIIVYKATGIFLAGLSIISYMYITIRICIALKKKKSYILYNEWIILTGILLSILVLMLQTAKEVVIHQKAIYYGNFIFAYVLVMFFEFISMFSFMKIKRDEVCRFLKQNYIYIIGVLLLYYKQILVLRIININLPESIKLIAFPLLILAPCINKNSKRSIIYMNSVYFICTLILYADILYYSYSKNFVSIYQLDNLKYAKEIGTGLKDLVTFKSLIAVFIDNIIVLIGSFLILRNKPKDKNLVKQKLSKTLKAIIILLLLVFNISKINGSLQKDYNTYRYNITTMVENTTLYYYHVLDIKDYIIEGFIKQKVNYDDINKLHAKNKSEKETKTETDIKYQEIAKGSNVIILQLESFNSFVVNKTVNGKEITPNINKFFSENIQCEDMYNQGLGTTADSEHTIATSLYPLENGRVFEKYFKNTYYNIYSILKENGYYTSFMHPHIATFWNRNAIYNDNYEIDEFNDDSKFDSHGEIAYEWFPDEHFFTQAVDIMKEYKEPFCSMLVSVSSHIPFSLEGINDLESKLTIDVSNIENNSFRDYLLSCNYVDYSFGKFIEELEKTSLIDNSIIIVYGDHGAGLSNVSDEISKLCEENGIEYTYSMAKLENTQIPFGMKVPNIGPTLIKNTVSKIDVKPTVLSLLGIKDEFSLGQNIFTDKDYSFIKGLGFVTSDTYFLNNEYIDRKTDESIEATKELEGLKNRMMDEITFSDMIIKNDLLRKDEREKWTD